jgi:hypothetical protein
MLSACDREIVSILVYLVLAAEPLSKIQGHSSTSLIPVVNALYAHDARPDKGGPRSISIVKVLGVDLEDDGVFVSVITSIGVSGHSSSREYNPLLRFRSRSAPNRWETQVLELV